MLFGAPSCRLNKVRDYDCARLGSEHSVPAPSWFHCHVLEWPSTYTTEVKMMRQVQGVDLARLDATQDVSKQVLHEVIGVEEAIQSFDNVIKMPTKYPRWLMIVSLIWLVYVAICSLSIGYGITVGTTIYGLMDTKANPPHDV